MAPVAVASRSKPSTLKMVLEAIGTEDGKNGVSVQEIKRRILAKYPETQEVRLRTNMKRAFEKALADGTVVRVKSQTDAGSALTGSFRIANKLPATKVKAPGKAPGKAPAKKPAAVVVEGVKGKMDVPTLNVTYTQKAAEGKKPAVKRKPTAKAAKAAVKKTVSTASTASTASAASATSAASLALHSSRDTSDSSPHVSPTRRAGRPVPEGQCRETPVPSPASPASPDLRASRLKKALEDRPPAGKENVPPGRKAAGNEKAPAVAAAGKTVKPGPKRTKGKAGPASKVAGK